MCPSYEAVLAGNGSFYVSLQSGGLYPRTTAKIYGAHIMVSDNGQMRISNGEHEIVLDLTDIRDPYSKLRVGYEPDPGAEEFNAPVVSVGKGLGFMPTRVEVLVCELDDVIRRDPYSVAQDVMHTTRDLHGPGPYREDTKWGAWINSYRAESEKRKRNTSG